MEKKLEVVGIVDPNGYEIRNRVYGMRGGYQQYPQEITKIQQKSSEDGEVVFKVAMTLNPMKTGIARTIKSQYYKNSVANFLIQGSRGATGVIRKRCQKKS